MALWSESWGVSFPAILGTPQSVSEYGAMQWKAGREKEHWDFVLPPENIASVVRRKIFLS